MATTADKQMSEPFIDVPEILEMEMSTGGIDSMQKGLFFMLSFIPNLLMLVSEELTQRLLCCFIKRKLGEACC